MEGHIVIVMSPQITVKEVLAVSKKTDTKWNSSTFCGTVPKFVEQRPNNVEQLPKKWNSSCNSSTNSGTEGQIENLKFSRNSSIKRKY